MTLSNCWWAQDDPSNTSFFQFGALKIPAKIHANVMHCYTDLLFKLFIAWQWLCPVTWITVFSFIPMYCLCVWGITLRSPASRPVAIPVTMAAILMLRWWSPWSWIGHGMTIVVTTLTVPPLSEKVGRNKKLNNFQWLHLINKHRHRKTNTAEGMCICNMHMPCCIQPADSASLIADKHFLHTSFLSSNCITNCLWFNHFLNHIFLHFTGTFPRIKGKHSENSVSQM